MILFFYGEDTYRLKQKIDELKAKYVSASLGDTNLVVLEANETDYAQVYRQVMALPFLAKTRLVILKNVFKEGKKELQEKLPELLDKVPETTVLVVAEFGKPDKRLVLFKKLNKPQNEAPLGSKKIWEFNQLNPYEIDDWIKKEVKNRGAEIEPAAASKLAEYVGNDLWRISNELDKLINYSSSKPNNELRITLNDVLLLVRPQFETTVFALNDALIMKNREKALKELHQLTGSGEAELMIFAMIVSQYRNLLIAKDMEERQGRALRSFELAKLTGINPYVAQKISPYLSHFTLKELKDIYRQLLDYDLKMKTGKIEPKTALDLLVVKLCA